MLASDEEDEDDDEDDDDSLVIGSKGVLKKLQAFLRKRKWNLQQLYRSQRVNKDQSQFLNVHEFH